MNIPKLDGSASLPDRKSKPAGAESATASPARSAASSVSRNLVTEARGHLSRLGESSDTKRSETIKQAKAERDRGELTSSANLFGAAQSLLLGDDAPDVAL